MSSPPHVATASLAATSTAVTGDSVVIPADLLKQIHTRTASAQYCFKKIPVEEACKGLSRVLQAGNKEDVENFGSQLRRGDRAACVPNYRGCRAERIPCFAVSYVQNNPPDGRYKFSEEQWGSLCRALSCLASRFSRDGVMECRIWLDQCVWLQDARQGCWAETGIMPYVLWPVISLGDKSFQGDRTMATYERMWPFVEEVAGLWSLGVIMARERRGRRKEDGCCQVISYNQRERLEPEESMRLLLLNVYHGAADELQTGWKEDVEELREMAKWNLERSSGELIIGHDWERRSAARSVRKPLSEKIQGMALWRGSEQVRGEFLDGTKHWKNFETWHGLLEWMSWNVTVDASNLSESEAPDKSFKRDLTKINVVTDKGEFQLLGYEGRVSNGIRAGSIRTLWLLVAMDGLSACFSRGTVMWTKVLHGGSSCILTRISPPETVELVLREQLAQVRGFVPREVNVKSVKDWSERPIEWI